jgi:hypothetical protein
VPTERMVVRFRDCKAAEPARNCRAAEPTRDCKVGGATEDNPHPAVAMVGAGEDEGRDSEVGAGEDRGPDGEVGGRYGEVGAGDGARDGEVEASAQQGVGGS